MKLNDDQLKCKADILNSIETGVEFHTLSGAAGVGKTTLIADIINSIPKGKSICVATPTHKAVKVARRMGLESGAASRCTYATIHSILGIKPVRQNGEEVFMKDKYVEEKCFDVLFIDEASMLGSDIIEYILECESIIVIFIGDQFQISPVNNGGRISTAFTEVEASSRLTKIVRYDNPIINLATAYRYSQAQRTPLPAIKPDLDDNGQGIQVYSFKPWFNAAMREFTSEDFKTSTDHCRIVAYTNKAVDALNTKIRKIIYGDDVDEFIVGEVLVTQKGHKRGDFNNSDELKIVNVESMYDYDNNYDYWEIGANSLEDGKYVTINVLKQSSLDNCQRRLSELSASAYEDLEKSAGYWKDFWTLMDKYLPVKHIYCCTAHKSQGSTFKNTYILLNDFLKSDNLYENHMMELKQLIYTSLTRSSHLTTFAS
ncbi:DNA helicase [Paraglaciecola Antarctic GD virus 1]|nr:DNA helicase [Paraglaciecola Antarctic GD virus 1]